MHYGLLPVVQLPPCPKEFEAQTGIFPARLPNPLIEPANFCKSMSPKCAIRGKGKGSLVSVQWLFFLKPPFLVSKTSL
jgi:hypothetical protein